MNRTRLAATLMIAGLCSSSSLVAQQLAAHWSGVAAVHGELVPVHLDLNKKAAGGTIAGSFVNGPEHAPASSGQLSGQHLVLTFDYVARKLEGDFAGDTFSGTYSGARMEPLQITLHADRPGTLKSTSASGAAKLNGDWEMAVKSSKGESAWTLRLSTARGPQPLKAVILRIDGDTGGLYGGFDRADGDYKVGHFSASGPALYSIKPQADGTLLVSNLLHEGQPWTARRPSEARRENLAPPTKSTDQTGVVDPSKPLRFSAVSLDGKTVTNDDPRFKGKVVIVALGGSWCPNCHDEAPFLVELYNRYHARGLEIVELSFEEQDQLKDPRRLRAFQAHYQIPYPILLAGTPDEVNQKLPQGKNLNCWPTAFFIGRDGLVKETHAGFSGPATGAAYVQLKAETDALIQKLLKN